LRRNNSSCSAVTIGSIMLSLLSTTTINRSGAVAAGMSVTVNNTPTNRTAVCAGK
jgi:hypothetical protein